MPLKSTCAPGASLSQTPVGDGRWYHTRRHTYETRWNFSTGKLKKRPDEKTLLVRYRECGVNAYEENILSLFAHAIARASDISVWMQCKWPMNHLPVTPEKSVEYYALQFLARISGTAKQLESTKNDNKNSKYNLRRWVCILLNCRYTTCDSAARHLKKRSSHDRL